ncbi:MAG TPA: ROK family protein [bacterium]|nr:ROK family protein [bacterium]
MTAPKFILGIDIGGTKCAVVLGNDRMKVYDRIAFATHAGLGLRPALKNLMGALDEILIRNGLKSSSVRRVGISCGGPLDSRKGLILSPPNLPGWNRVPIVRLVRQKLGCPTRLENDANACAAAEWKYGAGKGRRNLVFLTFGTGLGAGLILDGKLYRGTNDMAGEAGHIRLAEDGPPGYGKKGSFEGFCSGGGLARWAAAQGLTGLSAKELFELGRGGNRKARELLRESARYLGKGLAILIDLLNPEIIILGGIYARNERLLRPEALKVIRKEALARSQSVCRIVPSGLGERIGDVAALSVAVMEE